MTDFREVDRKFAKLRQRLADGELSESDLDEWRAENVVRDGRGRRWMKVVTVGGWFFDDGDGWILGVPPGYPLVANGQVLGISYEGKETELLRVTDFFEFEGRTYILLKGDEEGLDVKRVAQEGCAFLSELKRAFEAALSDDIEERVARPRKEGYESRREDFRGMTAFREPDVSVFFRRAGRPGHRGPRPRGDIGRFTRGPFLYLRVGGKLGRPVGLGGGDLPRRGRGRRRR